MASAAQIDANRRNAALSTGPRTDDGKNMVRRNALKHGLAAFTVVPVLPDENPNELEERIKRYVDTLQPGNEAEYNLVVQAAELSLAIERGERIESAYLAGLVLQAGREADRKSPAQSNARKFASSAASCSISPGQTPSTASCRPGTTTRSYSSASSKDPQRAAAGC